MGALLDSALDRYQRHVNSGMARLARLTGAGIEVHSEGSYVFDQEGRKYLDCGGYSVFLLGHRHPRLVSAIKGQLDRHPLATRILVNDELAKAAETLVDVAPAGLEYVWFANSGAEAVEAALKLARLQGKRRLIAMKGGYHGKTLGALSVTYNPLYRAPYEPLLPDVEFVPFGDAAALDVALNRGSDCCVIVEPVQSECGVVIPPEGYLRQVEQLCRRSEAFVIFDEISVGLGRVGHWWAADREGVAPDVLLAGKALSGGVIPVSAAICTEAAYRPLNRDPMLHTSTFGGNPLACIAARTTIEVIRDEGLVARAHEMGDRLLAEICAILKPVYGDCVREVRGLGLLFGIEFLNESVAGEFFVNLLGHHVLASHSLNAHKVVRLTPPAIMGETEMDWLLTAVEASMRQIVASPVSRQGNPENPLCVM
jgi:putrescine aminotransferase